MVVMTLYLILNDSKEREDESDMRGLMPSRFTIKSKGSLEGKKSI